MQVTRNGYADSRALGARPLRVIPLVGHENCVSGGLGLETPPPPLAPALFQRCE